MTFGLASFGHSSLMYPPRCDDLGYIQSLVAAQKIFTCIEAAKCYLEDEDSPAHDALTRLLQRQLPDTEALWQESKRLIGRDKGEFTLADTTLDKPYAQKADPVTYHWSGKHIRMVNGIDLLPLLWSDGGGVDTIRFQALQRSRRRTDEERPLQGDAHQG